MRSRPCSTALCSIVRFFCAEAMRGQRGPAPLAALHARTLFEFCAPPRNCRERDQHRTETCPPGRHARRAHPGVYRMAPLCEEDSHSRVLVSFCRCVHNGRVQPGPSLLASGHSRHQLRVPGPVCARRRSQQSIMPPGTAEYKYKYKTYDTGQTRNKRRSDTAPRPPPHTAPAALSQSRQRRTDCPNVIDTSVLIDGMPRPRDESPRIPVTHHTRISGLQCQSRASRRPRRRLLRASEC